jgi:hypothetical protein
VNKTFTSIKATAKCPKFSSTFAQSDMQFTKFSLDCIPLRIYLVTNYMTLVSNTNSEKLCMRKFFLYNHHLNADGENLPVGWMQDPFSVMICAIHAWMQTMPAQHV